jgi:hypothetical protein
MTPSLANISTERPFPGLRPFGFDDRAFFFGREDQACTLYRLLDCSRFIAVVGSSGSGKSSLVRAGLLSLLEEECREADGQPWKWLEMRPGDAPVRELAKAFSGMAAGKETDPAIDSARHERIAFALESSSLGVSEALELAGSGPGKILLVVDQFEELFRFLKPEGGDARAALLESRRREEAAHFVQLLLEASRNRTLQVHVLITLRADFIGDCASFPGLPEAVVAAQFLVPNLTREQRQQVICRPVEVAGSSLEPVLIERLLNDSNEAIDQLPVLQHCLMRLWQQAEPKDAGSPRLLQPHHYNSIGGIKDALSNHADEILSTLTNRFAVEQVFRALSEVDKDGRATRRSLFLWQLVAETGVPRDEVCAVVDRFRADDCSFLVPAPSQVEELLPETRIDVGHEALLRNWKCISGSPGGTEGKERTGWLWSEEKDGRTYKGLLALVDTGATATEVTLPLDQVGSRWNWWYERNRTEAWAARYGGGFGLVTGMLHASQGQLAKHQRRRRFIRASLVLVGAVAAIAAGTELCLYLNGLQNSETTLMQRLGASQKLARDENKKSVAVLSAAQGVLTEVTQKTNSEEVSPAVARLASTVAASAAPQEGYLWIGSDSKTYFLDPRDRSTRVYPADVKEGSQYVVAWNILLREGFPSESPDLYYRSRKSIGVVPEWTVVRTLTPTHKYKHHGTQYWVRVRCEGTAQPPPAGAPHQDGGKP